MGEVIRVEDLDVSPEEKKLIIKALNDKKFRDDLERRVSAQTSELGDDELDQVVGGMVTMSMPQLHGVLAMVKHIEGRIGLGAAVLCM